MNLPADFGTSIPIMLDDHECRPSAILDYIEHILS